MFSRHKIFLVALWLCLIVCLRIFAVSGERAWAANKSKPNEACQYELPKGLRLVMLEDHSFPIVSCLIFYRVGSRNEQPGTTGLAHLVEHLLFGQVGSFKKGEIGSSIVRLGGQFNGFTSDDFITFFATLPPSRLELAFKSRSPFRLRS